MGYLENKRAVVTGASQGIGQAIAFALAEAGAHVAGVYIGDVESGEITRRGIESRGSRALLAATNMADPEAVDAFANNVTSQWGGIDIWVNNAARLLVKPFLELTDADWHGILSTNLHGYFYGCRAAARQMILQGDGGRIINIGSVAQITPPAELAAYVAAKGGVVALSRALSVELAPHGITVNTLSPGSVDTPLNATAYTPQVRRRYEERIPLQRISTPDEIAAPVVFLCGEGSSYITGSDIIVDGGFVRNGTVGHGRSHNAE